MSFLPKKPSVPPLRSPSSYTLKLVSVSLHISLRSTHPYSYISSNMDAAYSDLNAPHSMGTTIIGVTYNGGVVLGADSRTSTGTLFNKSILCLNSWHNLKREFHFSSFDDWLAFIFMLQGCTSQIGHRTKSPNWRIMSMFAALDRYVNFSF